MNVSVNIENGKIEKTEESMGDKTNKYKSVFSIKLPNRRVAKAQSKILDNIKRKKKSDELRTLHQESNGISDSHINILKDDLWWLVFILLSFFGLLTRLHYITIPNAVVWDESHFGKMAGMYINRTFFFDVHPPGGKLLLAALGYFGGYNGSHSFSRPGLSYEGYEGIIYMRLGCALLGAGMVPLSFLIVWEMTTSLMASAFAGLFCCYEIGWIVLSKFILLDPLLMFFMMASLHGLSMINRQYNRAWSGRWWFSLVYTGFSLGCTVSVKFVGVFIVLVLGLFTVCDLWAIFCDTANSMIEICRHFAVRVLCLILLPLTIYVAIFYVHDQVLIYDTSTSEASLMGTGFYSSAFQKRLINSSLYNIVQPAEPSYGSVVTIKSDNIGAGYFHSHNYTYPEEHIRGKLKQVTAVSSKDINNIFRILFPEDDPDLENGFYEGEPEVLQNKNWIRLFHIATNSTIACHRNRSIAAFKMNLVYGKAYNLSKPEDEPRPKTKNFMDDIWSVKIKDGYPDEPLKTFHTRFQLISPKFKCAMVISQQKLSHIWGFNQDEISCTRNLNNPHSFWTFETVYNPYSRNVTFDNVTLNFWERFMESHLVMKIINSQLKPVDDDDIKERPWMWPILYRIFPWYDINFRVTLMGNPLQFLLNLMALLVTPFLIVAYYYRRCRNPESNESDTTQDGMTDEKFIFGIKWIFITYLFNYVPFYTMDRILYFHHYFPSQMFACLLSAILLSRFITGFASYFSDNHKRTVLRANLLIATSLCSVSFFLYCYVGYGITTSGSYDPRNSTFKPIRLNEYWFI